MLKMQVSGLHPKPRAGDPGIAVHPTRQVILGDIRVQETRALTGPYRTDQNPKILTVTQASPPRHQVDSRWGSDPPSPGLSATSARWREVCRPGVHEGAESPAKQLHLGPQGWGAEWPCYFTSAGPAPCSCRTAVPSAPNLPADHPPPLSSSLVCTDGSWLHAAPGRVYGSGQSR